VRVCLPDAHGVQYAWLANPREKTLEVLERQGATQVGVAGFTGDEKVRVAPFEALEIELATLWDRGPG
jgi:Uma2 family endonuclease